MGKWETPLIVMGCSECQHHRDKCTTIWVKLGIMMLFYQQLCCSKFSDKCNIVCCSKKLFVFSFVCLKPFSLQMQPVWHWWTNLERWVILATLQYYQNRKCVQSLLETRAGPFFTFVCSKKATLCLLSINASVGLSQKMWLTPFLNQYRFPLGDYSACHQL